MLVNIGLQYLKNDKCPLEFKPAFYGRYVDDIFVLFKLPKSIHSFCQCMYINFTTEYENIGPLLLLDVKIYRKSGKFVTSVYRKFPPIKKV